MAERPGVELREGYVPGAIGRIVEMHAVVYRDLAGFGLAFESKVARELSAFCENYRPGRDGLWIAVRGDRIEGSIAIDGSRAHIDGAHLRWFITSEAVRGGGTGGELLARALDFCADEGYGTTYLWTFDGLHAARRLYERAGFRLIEQRRASTWGKEVDEQRFVRTSPQGASGR